MHHSMTNPDYAALRRQVARLKATTREVGEHAPERLAVHFASLAASFNVILTMLSALEMEARQAARRTEP